MAKTQTQLTQQFMQRHYRRFEFSFHKTYDAEILEYFESIPKKREYVKNLIKEDFEKKKKTKE